MSWTPGSGREVDVTAIQLVLSRLAFPIYQSRVRAELLELAHGMPAEGRMSGHHTPV